MTLKTVTKSSPCPICGKPDQCSKNDDGLVCCWRVTGPVNGWAIKKTETGKDGRDYTLYTQNTMSSYQTTNYKAPVTDLKIAAVYEFILRKLPVCNEDLKQLRDRGIMNVNGRILFALSFGSMPFHNSADRGEVAQKLLEKFGDDIYRVPGISKNCPSGKGVKPWIEGQEGLMIPARDYAGNITAIMLRPRIRGEGPKYLFMSSSKHGGASATPSLHFSIQFKTNHRTGKPIFITEGYLKADVLCMVHGLPVLGTPANNVEPANWFISSNPLETFILAYDQDANETARKTTSLNLLKTFIKFPEHDIRMAVWDGSKGKGLDDLLAAKGEYEILDRQKSIQYLEQFATIKELNKNQYLEQSNAEDMRSEWSECLLLKNRFGKNISFINEWDDFLIWSGGIWKRDKYGPHILYKTFLRERLEFQLNKLGNPDTNEALECSRVKWLKSCQKLGKLNSIISHIKSESDLRKFVHEIPVIRNVLACPNGTIDLTNGELRKHKRSDWQQAMCPTNYNPQAKCDRWLQLLDDVFLGSKDLIRYVQKLFGMAITGQPNDHLFPVFCGDGRNGKSTILGTIQQVLGSGLAAQVNSNHLCKGNDSHPTWLASFHGKRLMVAQETARGAELNVSLVKLLTGGDMITCRRMHENEWQFAPTHTLILCTNEKPNIPESNTAIWSRISLVPFKASFSLENGNLDTSLPVKIMEESEGILNWLVQGSLLYQQEGLTKPDEIIRQVQEYREDNDPEQSITVWLNQFSWPRKNEDDEGDELRSSTLHQFYWDWCLHNGIRHLGIKNFSIALTKEHRGLVYRTLDGCRVFKKKSSKT
jgi:P4 family phage/plasmid primase-like protien